MEPNSFSQSSQFNQEEQQAQEIESLITPTKSLGDEETKEEQYSTTKKFDNQDLQDVSDHENHPLSVYFKNAAAESAYSGSNENRPTLMDLSKSSERNRQNVAGTDHHTRSKNSGGMPSVFGSIETSPNNHATGRSFKSPRSQQQEMINSNRRSSTEERDSSSKGQSNPADNYQFLGGIREVDDDQESMSGTIGSNNKPSVQQKLAGSFYGGSQDHSNRKSGGHYMYGTVQERAANPFIHHGQWSSDKSRDSGQLSFGHNERGPINEIDEGGHSPSVNILSSEKYTDEQFSDNPAFQNSGNLVDKLLTRAYNSTLVHMGEKACMRMCLKELAVTMDGLNQKMCQQAVQRELISNPETTASQLKQLLDMSTNEESEEEKRQSKKAKIESIRKKSNLQLIESIRLDTQMMEMRFSDFFNKENNVYTKLAEEREKNTQMEQMISRLEGFTENGSAQRTSIYYNTYKSDYIDTENPTKNSSAAFINLANNSYYRDTIEQDKNNHQRHQTQLNQIPSVEQLQLSPGSPFHVRNSQASPVQNNYTPSPDREMPYQEGGQVSFRNNQMSLQKKLFDKDAQIKQLTEYLETMKKEFTFYRQNSTLKQNMIKGTNTMLSQSPQSTNQKHRHSASINNGYHTQLLELHSTIYELQQQNTELIQRLSQQQSAHKQLTSPESNIKVQDGLDNSMAQQLIHLNANSSSSSPSPSPPIEVTSYVQTGSLTRTNNQSKAQLLVEHINRSENQSMYHKTVSLDSAHNHQIKVGGQSLTGQPSAETTQNMKFSSRIGHEDIARVEEICVKLETQQRQIQRLDEQERKLIEQLKQKDRAYYDLQRLNLDLKEQSVVNSEALEKAQVVIQKLNNDLQRSLEAATLIQNENKTLKNDNMLCMKRMQEQLTIIKSKEQGMEAQMQRAENEMQLEIRDLKQKLNDSQREFTIFENELQAQIKEQKEQLNKQIAINTSLEQKQQADQAKANTLITQKTNELLEMHNQNLSLKIQMRTLETQVREDLEITQDLHRRECLFMKNKINDQQQLINSATQNRRFYGDEIAHTEKDGQTLPKIGETYLSTLKQEFIQLSDELGKLRDLTNNESPKNIESFLNKHMKKFGEFKVSVLDNLVNWHQKSTELSKLASKYYDNLEEYKMLFVAMKQLIKEKDLMHRKTTVQLSALKQKFGEHYQQVTQEMKTCNSNTISDLKKMTRTLEDKILLKEEECEALIKYQEEFREEYIKVCHERDDFKDRLYRQTQINDHLSGDLQRLESKTLSFKQQLRETLGIEMSAHCLEIIPQHAQMIVENNKNYKQKISGLELKQEEMEKEMQSQRALFQEQTNELEKQMEDAKTQYLKRQNESNEDFDRKEREYEAKNQQLQEVIDQSNQELALRDRQLKKHQEKVDYEVAKQHELHKQIEALIGDNRHILENRRAMEETYSILEDKLHTTEQLLDDKVRQVDQLELDLKNLFEKADRLEIQLKDAHITLDNKVDQLKKTRHDYDDVARKQLKQEEELKIVQNRLDSVSKENARLKANEHVLMEGSQQHIQKIEILEHEEQVYKEQIDDLQQEIKTYKDSFNYIHRELDCEKLKNQDNLINIKQNEQLRETIALKEELIDRLYAQYVDVPRNQVATQTVVSANNEIDRAKQAASQLSAENYELQGHIVQLREVIQRQVKDIDRLIDDKRQLEAEIQQRNENINVTNVNSTRYILRQRSNSPPADSTTMSNFNKRAESNSLNNLKMILNEKENYIGKLNTELNELRQENEKLKDKLIYYEMENLGHTQGVRSHIRKAGTTVFSNNSRTLADTRSNTQNHFHSNFGQTHTHFLSMERTGNSFSRTRDERLVSPSNMEQSYMTQNVHIGMSPNQPIHINNEAVTPTLQNKQNGNNEFYTLQQSYQSQHQPVSEGNLSHYLHNSSSVNQSRSKVIPPYQPSMSTMEQAKAATGNLRGGSPRTQISSIAANESTMYDPAPQVIFRNLAK